MPKKVYAGKVISDKMDKTVTVTVTTLRKHRLYKKHIKRITIFKVHDENNRCRTGDTVKIIESRPKSKTKHWVVIDILNKG